MDELNFMFFDDEVIQCIPLGEVEWMLSEYCFYKKEITAHEVSLNILTVL